MLLVLLEQLAPPVLQGPLVLQVMLEKTAVWDQPVPQGPLAPMGLMAKWGQRVQPALLVLPVLLVRKAQQGLQGLQGLPGSSVLLVLLVLLVLPAMPGLLGWLALLEIQVQLEQLVKPGQPAPQEKFQTMCLHLLSMCNTPFNKGR